MTIVYHDHYPDELVPTEDAIGYALAEAGLPHEFNVFAYLAELEAVRRHNDRIHKNTSLFGRRKDRPS